MKRKLTIFSLCLIVHTWSYSNSLQDSTLINHIRKANELILKGKKCCELDSLKSLQLIELDYQVSELKQSLIDKDIIISNQKLIISNTEGIVEQKEIQLKEEEKRHKKTKMKWYVTGIMAVIFLII